MKRITLLFAALASVVMLLAGCSGGAVLRSDVRSVPAASDSLAKLTSMVVSVPVDDISFRLVLEEELVSKIGGNNLKVYQFTKIFPPVKSYSDQEIKKTLSGLGVQAVLVVDLKSDKEVQAGTATIGSAVGPVSAWGYPSGSGVFVQGVTATSSESATRVLSKREVRGTVTIYDVSSENKLWIAGLVTQAEQGARRGRAITEDFYLAEISAAQISEALSRDGLVRKKKRFSGFMGGNAVPEGSPLSTPQSSSP